MQTLRKLPKASPNTKIANAKKRSISGAHACFGGWGHYRRAAVTSQLTKELRLLFAVFLLGTALRLGGSASAHGVIVPFLRPP